MAATEQLERPLVVESWSADYVPTIASDSVPAMACVVLQHTKAYHGISTLPSMQKSIVQPLWQFVVLGSMAVHSSRHHCILHLKVQQMLAIIAAVLATWWHFDHTQCICWQPLPSHY